MDITKQVHRCRVHGRSRYGRAGRVTVRYRRSKILNARNVAFSSLVGWGPVQDSYKIDSHFGDCWWVSTSGHGGFILVTTIKLLPEWAGTPVLAVDLPHGPTMYVHEFEEDCGWSRLIMHDELAAKSDWEHRRSWDKDRSFEEYMEMARTCRDRWFPVEA